MLDRCGTSISRRTDGWTFSLREGENSSRRDSGRIRPKDAVIKEVIFIGRVWLKQD